MWWRSVEGDGDGVGGVKVGQSGPSSGQKWYEICFVYRRLSFHPISPYPGKVFILSAYRKQGKIQVRRPIPTSMRSWTPLIWERSWWEKLNHFRVPIILLLIIIIIVASISHKNLWITAKFELNRATLFEHSDLPSMSRRIFAKSVLFFFGALLSLELMHPWPSSPPC